MLKFINNFKTTLAQPLADGDFFAVLPPADAARLAALLDNSTFSHQIMLTLYDNTNLEIVVVDGADSGTGEIYLYRGQENTLAREWPSETTISARLTARAVAALPVLGVAMQLTGADGVLQDADGNILINPDLPTFFWGADPFGITDIQPT